ncbi:MAG: SHOCT domain-containing protein [Desulfobacteraceae bacterium]|nr:SHOCT domain-containing protein [Desulfobacteraceae bacterium]
MWNHGMGYSMGWGQCFSGYGILGFFLNILIISIVIALVVSFFRSRNSTPHENRDTQDSLDILKKRLASGEISEDDYLRIKKNL